MQEATSKTSSTPSRATGKTEREPLTFGRLTQGLLGALNEADSAKRGPAMEQAFSLLTEIEMAHPNEAARHYATTLKREVRSDGWRRAGKLGELGGQVDAAYEKWRGLAAEVDRASSMPRTDAEFAASMEAPKAETDAAYSEYLRLAAKQDELRRGLQGLYTEDEGTSIWRFVTGQQQRQAGYKSKAVRQRLLKSDDVEFGVPDDLFDLPALSRDPAWKERWATLMAPIEERGGRKVISLPGGNVMDLTDDLERFNKPEVRDSIRKAVLGIDPRASIDGTLQQGSISESLTRRLTQGIAELYDAEDMTNGYLWNVRGADPGWVLPYLPKLYSDEEGGDWRSFQALKSARGFRAFAEVVADMEEKGEIRRSFMETFTGQAVGMAEFYATVATGEAALGAAAKGLSLAKAAKGGTMASRLPVAPWMARTGTQAAKLFGAGRPWMRGLEFGARDIAEEAMYGTIAGWIDPEGTGSEGFMQGVSEGIAEAGLATVSRAGRRVAGKALRPLLSDDMRRLGDASLGSKPVEHWLSRLENLPSQRVDLEKMLGRDFRNARLTQHFLKGMDAAFVGASFGAYEAALRTTGAEDWEKMSLDEKAMAIAGNMASPEALGNVSVFMGTGTLYGTAQELGLGAEYKLAQEQERKLYGELAREMVREMQSPDNWSQWKSWARMYDDVRKANPEIAKDVEILSPLERAARRGDNMEEWAHWAQLKWGLADEDPLAKKQAKKEGGPDRVGAQVFRWRRQGEKSAEELGEMRKPWVPARVTGWNEGARGAISEARYEVRPESDTSVRLHVHKGGNYAIKTLTEVGDTWTTPLYGIVDAKNPTKPVENTHLWTTLEGAIAQAEHVLAGTRRKPPGGGQGAKKKPDPTPPGQGEFDFQRAEFTIKNYDEGEVLDPVEIEEQIQALSGYEGPVYDGLRATLERIQTEAAFPREETQGPQERAAARRAQAIDPQTAHEPPQAGPELAAKKERRETVKRAQPPAKPKLPEPELDDTQRAEVEGMAGMEFEEIMDALAAEAEEIPTESLLLDPDFYQHKSGTEEGTGVDPKSVLSSKSVKRWQPSLSRPIIVFEHSDGRRVVADGHQRTAFAKRIGKETIGAIVLREADGITPDHAAAIAAMTNLGVGTATAVDVAKVLRGSAVSDDQLQGFGVDPKRALARTATGLAKLDPVIFRMVEIGELTEIAGAEIGQEMGHLPHLQRHAAKAMKDSNPDAAYARMLARQIANDGAQSAGSTSQGSMFGEEDVSVYQQKAKLLRDIIRRVKREKSAFGSLARNADFAEKIQGHIDVSRARSEHGELGIVVEAIAKLGTLRGTEVNQIVTEAVAREDGLEWALKRVREADLTADADTARQQDPVAPPESGVDEGGAEAERNAWGLRQKATGQVNIFGEQETVEIEGDRFDLTEDRAEVQVGLYDEQGGLFEDQAAARDQGYQALPKILDDIQAGRRVLFVTPKQPKDLVRDLEREGIAYVDVHRAKKGKHKPVGEAGVVLVPSAEVAGMLDLEGEWSLHEPGADVVVRTFEPVKKGPHPEAPSGVEYLEGATYKELPQGFLVRGVSDAWARKNLHANVTSYGEGTGLDGAILVPLSARARVEAMVTPPPSMFAAQESEAPTPASASGGLSQTKVVTRRGNPLMVYHDTRAEFDEFKRGAPSDYSYGKAEDSGGIFFYTEPGGEPAPGERTVRAYLDIRNPWIYKRNPKEWGGSLEEQALDLKKYEEMGYDGAFIPDAAGWGGQWVAFRPDQIHVVTDGGDRLRRQLGIEDAFAPPPSSFEGSSDYAIDRLLEEPEAPTHTRAAQAAKSIQQLFEILDVAGVLTGETDSSLTAFAQVHAMAAEDPRMLPAFQKSSAFADVNAAQDAYNEAVGHARNYLSFLQLSAISAARGDKQATAIVTGYFRAREDVARTGEISDQARAELEGTGLLDEKGIYFRHGSEELLHEWLAEATREAMQGGPEAFGAGLPMHLFDFMRRGLEAPDYVTADRGFPHRWSRAKRMLERTLALPGLRRINMAVTKIAGRPWDAAGLPRVVQKQNYDFINKNLRPAQGRRGTLDLLAADTVKLMGFQHAPLPREVAERMPGFIRSGVLRRAKGPGQWNKMLGTERFEYLFPVVRRMQEQAAAIGARLRDQGFISDAQLDAWVDSYLMHAYVRAENGSMREKMQQGNFVGMLAARDLSVTEGGRQNMALAIQSPEYLHQTGMMQEARISMMLEILQGLAADGTAVSAADFNARRADGRPVWDQHTRRWYETAAVDLKATRKELDPQTGGMRTQRDPQTGAKVKGRQAMLHHFLTTMREQMAYRGEERTGGKHPWTRQKAEMLDYWLGKDPKRERRFARVMARRARKRGDDEAAKRWTEEAKVWRARKPGGGAVISQHVAKELEILLRDMADTTPNTQRAFFGADSAQEQGVLAEHWAKRLDEMSRWWRRGKTVQSPVHWTLARVSDVVTNFFISDVPLHDFASSVLFGRGTWADGWRHLLWWQRWQELDKPGLSATGQLAREMPAELAAEGWTAQQWAAIHDVQEASEFLLGGTFVTTLVQSGAISDLLGAGLDADNMTDRLRRRIAERAAMGEGSETVALLGDAISDYGRRVSRGVEAQDKRFLEVFGSSEPGARVEAIAGWTAQYQVWELAAKYVAALSSMRRTPGMRFKDALIVGARGTVDYANTSPWLRQWSTRFNFASGGGWDALDKNPGLNRFARMLTASPFHLYQASMVPQALSALASPRGALKVGVGLSLLAMARSAWMGLQEPEELERALLLSAVSKEAGGTPLLSHREAHELMERFGVNRFWSALGGDNTAASAEKRAAFFASLLTLSPSSLRAPAPRYGEVRTTDIAELTGPAGLALDAARLGRDVSAQPAGDSATQALKALNGYVPSMGSAMLSGIVDSFWPKSGQTRGEATIQSLAKGARQFMPVLHPEGYLYSDKGQLWFDLGPLQGQTLRDYMAGRVQATPKPADQRLKAGLFGTLWKSREVFTRTPGSGQEDIGSAIFSQIRDVLAVEGGDDESKAWRGASRKIGDQFFETLGSVYDRWASMDFATPGTLDAALARHLDLTGDIDLEAAQAGSLSLVERPTSDLGRMIARQPAGEQERLLEVGMAFLGGPAWDGAGKDLILQSARLRKFEPPALVALYKAATRDRRGMGMLDYLHGFHVEQGQRRNLADTYPFFLELERPSSGPLRDAWDELAEVYEPWERGGAAREGRLPGAKALGPLGPVVGEEAEGVLTGPGARRELLRPR